MKKKQLRADILQKRDALTEHERTRLSQCIINNLFTLPEYQQAETLFCYVSFASEVETYSLMQQAWKAGKKIAVPRIENAQQIQFYLIENLTQLHKNRLGIAEPAAIAANCCIPDNKTLIVVPGLVFDSHHHRIGYGKGHYDRYLAQYSEGTTCGLCFSFQYIARLPEEEHDKALDIVVTETKCHIKQNK